MFYFHYSFILLLNMLHGRPFFIIQFIEYGQSMTRIPSCLISFTNFRIMYNSSCEWYQFSNFTRPQAWQLVLFLVHKFTFKAQLFTHPKIGLFQLVSHLMDFKYFRAHISPSMGWTSTFKALLRPLFGRICLELVSLCFILILRKVYRRYIFASRDFYTSLGLSLSCG